MPDATQELQPGGGLTEAQRVVDVFVAPTKTFTDILRSTRWWLPFLLLVLVTLGVSFTVDKTVGYERVAENQIHQNPKQEEQMQQQPPEGRARQLHGMSLGYRYSSYGSFLFILIFAGLFALLLWASFNFGLGAQTTFGQMFAVVMYASLPRLLTGLLTIITLLFGGSAESYDMRNPVGTNPAYYLADAAPMLKSALSFLDVIGLWVLILLVIGTAIVARVKVAQAATVVLGWWLVGLILSVGIAAFTS